MSDYHSKYHCHFDWNSIYSENGHFSSSSMPPSSAHPPYAYDASTPKPSFYQPYPPSIASFGHSFHQLNINPDVHIAHPNVPFSGSVNSSPTDSGHGSSPSLFQSSPDHCAQSPLHSLASTADSTVLPNNALKMVATSSLANALPDVPPSKSKRSYEKTRTDKYRIVYTNFQRQQLEEEFQRKSFIDLPRKEALSKELNLSTRQIKIWFQNRRAKGRRADQKKPLNLGDGYGEKIQERINNSFATIVKTENFGEASLTVQIPPPAVPSLKIPVHPGHSITSELPFSSSSYYHFGGADHQLLKPVDY